MYEDQDKDIEEISIEEDCPYISICTMCQGKGYVTSTPNKNKSPEPEIKETTFLPEIGHSRNLIKKPKSSDEFNGKSDQTTKSFRSLPAITTSRKTHLPHTVRDKELQETNVNKGYTQRLSKMPLRKSNNLASNTIGKAFMNTLPEPTAISRPQEMAKSLVCKLNDTFWEVRKSGVEDALQLSRFAPDILEPFMPLLNKTLCDLLCSLRSQVTGFACQAARELFCSMQSTSRPEFDELVHCLLNRTADTNKFIRHGANEALDSMVTFLPPIHAVRALVDKGPYHKNPLVRTACARLLTCVVALKTPFAILTQNYLRETCKRILESAAILLNDHNLDTRTAAKKLFQRFFKEEDFEEIYTTEVDEKLRKPIQGALALLMYKKE